MTAAVLELNFSDLAAAKAGDREAFSRLLSQVERPVLRICLRMLGNLSDAEDVAQDVLLKLYRSLAQFDAGREVMPWLYRITVNACFDNLRRKRASEELAEDLPAATRNVEEEIDQRRQRELLNRMLAKLTAQERAAIVLRDLEGQSSAEAAAVMNCSEATVRSHLSSARLKLKAMVEKR